MQVSQPPTGMIVNSQIKTREGLEHESREATVSQKECRVLFFIRRFEEVAMKRIFFISLSIFIVMPFLSSRSSAIMIGMGTEELTRESGIVIRGKVAKVEALWSEDGKTIITRATIIITNILKGEAISNMVTVEHEGGEIGEIGLRVSDVSPLNAGEDVILFLNKSAKSKIIGDVHEIVGKAQGKYIISNDGIARKGGFSVIKGESAIDNNISVDELIDKIRKVR